jgi:FG-GAP-like repeat
MLPRIRMAAPLVLLLLIAGASPAPPGFVITTIDLPLTPLRLGASDFDGDGDTDVIVCSRSDNASELTTLLNGPGGGFAVRWSVQLPGADLFYPTDLDVGDLDLDGDQDFIACVPYALLQSRLNAGDASFDAMKQLSGGPRAQNSLGQIDGDGIPDFGAVDHDILGYVGGHKGVGDGSFLEMNFEQLGVFIAWETRAELGDVTGDGLQDLVRASEDGLQYNRGTATAGFPGWANTVTVGTDAMLDLALADLDADGRLDAVVSVPNSNAIEVFHGLPGGGLGNVSPYPAGPTPGVLTVADMNNDGLLDVIVGNQVSGSITISPNEGGAVFLSPKAYRGGRGLTDIVAADLDGDGDVDLAGTHQQGQVSLQFNLLVP